MSKRRTPRKPKDGKDAVVGILLRASQIEKVEQVANDLGISRNELLRDAAMRRVAGFLNAKSPEVRRRLESLAGDLAKLYMDMVRDEAERLIRPAEVVRETPEDLSQARERFIGNELHDATALIEACGLAFTDRLVQALRGRDKDQPVRLIRPEEL